MQGCWVTQIWAKNIQPVFEIRSLAPISFVSTSPAGFSASSTTLKYPKITQGATISTDLLHILTRFPLSRTHISTDLVLALYLLPLVVHGVRVLRAQSVRASGTERGEVCVDLFLEESDVYDGSDVRNLRVGRPRRLGLLEREAALQPILLDVPDPHEFCDDFRQIPSGGLSRRRHAHHFVVQVLDRLVPGDVAPQVPAESRGCASRSRL